MGNTATNKPSPPPLSLITTSASVLLRRYTADAPILAATYATFDGDAPDESLVALTPRAVVVLPPRGAPLAAPLPAAAAAVWAAPPGVGVIVTRADVGAPLLLSAALEEPATLCAVTRSGGATTTTTWAGETVLWTGSDGRDDWIGVTAGPRGGSVWRLEAGGASASAPAAPPATPR